MGLHPEEKLIPRQTGLQVAEEPLLWEWVSCLDRRMENSIWDALPPVVREEVDELIRSY